MADHKLTSVQAICLLLQTAHNFDKSDLICVLVSSAIRISQCLNLHRMCSPEPRHGLATLIDGPADNKRNTQDIIHCEIKKRTWWFLVRYDWFQIPFQNTCQISPTQFNTPIPASYFEEPERMVKDGHIVSQPDSVCTPGLWGYTLNKGTTIFLYQHTLLPSY